MPPHPLARTLTGDRIRLVLTLILAVASASAFAQSPRLPITASQLQAIDDFVSIEMKREQIPGLAIGVYGRQVVLLAKGYGLANIEHRVPVKPETIFQSGSVGKQFVSAALK